MPQQNPTSSNGRSETFSQGMATADFINEVGQANSWYIIRTFTIPPEFTSVELVYHIRAPILGINAPVIYIYSNLTPGEDTISLGDAEAYSLPSAVGGGIADAYPGIVKIGIGPAFNGVSTQIPAFNGTDAINQPNFVRMMAVSTGVYVKTTISTPIQMVFVMLQNTVRPTLDATIYNTFYK